MKLIKSCAAVRKSKNVAAAENEVIAYPFVTPLKSLADLVKVLLVVVQDGGDDVVDMMPKTPTTRVSMMSKKRQGSKV